MIEIPARFAESLVSRQGSTGSDWLASLPRLITEICQSWGLAVDGEPLHETYALVIPARRGGEPMALKLTLPSARDAQEVTGLRAWDGQGVVRLLDVDTGRSALLLERLDSDHPLSALPLMDSAPIAGRLIRTLAINAPPEAPRLAERAAMIVATMPDRWEAAGRPLPQPLLTRTTEVARAIGPRSVTTLANWDLHHGNVLTGLRDHVPEWLAIDPVIVAGDPEVSLFPMVLRRIDEMEEPAELHAFVRLVVDAGGLDPELTAAWMQVRIVDYWLWALGIGLTEDPVRCGRLVAWFGLE